MYIVIYTIIANANWVITLTMSTRLLDLQIAVNILVLFNALSRAVFFSGDNING